MEDIILGDSDQEVYSAVESSHPYYPRF